VLKIRAFLEFAFGRKRTKDRQSLNAMTESPARIEPCSLASIPPTLADSIAELVRTSATLGQRLHPRTAQSLTELVAVMNCYYSNLIEGHHTRPREIERALANDLDKDERRNLQLEARSHIRVQKGIEERSIRGELGEPATREFVRELHRRFYDDATEEMLSVTGADGTTRLRLRPGTFRSSPQEDVAVGRHVPPSSSHVEDFMKYFEERFQLASLGPAQKVVAIAISHHRFNYIHPFLDGNGRVSRLMSHAMALEAGIGANGLWSISRGLARGLSHRSEYKSMMDATDSPRENDADGRGNLSARALLDFVQWFCRIANDQVAFMAKLFDFDSLRQRLRLYVLSKIDGNEDAAALADEAFVRGSFPRGDADRITRRSERTAREALRKLLQLRIVDSETPKGEVFLRFSSDSAEFLFPRLFLPEDLS